MNNPRPFRLWQLNALIELPANHYFHFTYPVMRFDFPHPSKYFEHYENNQKRIKKEREELIKDGWGWILE